MKRFLIILAAVAIAPAAAAHTDPAAPAAGVHTFVESVSVSGTGRVTVTPDRFIFNVGVQTVANTVDEAVAENNRRVASVIAALRQAGAEERQIQTSQFNIWPQQEHREGKLPRIVGYQVTNTITVRSTKVADAGRLLGVAIAAGVNTSSGINFEVSDPAAGRERGLRAAFDDARAKATALAQASGRTLGPALQITEGGGQVRPPHPPTRVMMMEAQAAVADVPIESGEQELVFTVSVTFGLR